MNLSFLYEPHSSVIVVHFIMFKPSPCLSSKLQQTGGAVGKGAGFNFQIAATASHPTLAAILTGSWKMQDRDHEEKGTAMRRS